MTVCDWDTVTVQILLRWAAVQHIMLDHKDDIEEYRYQPQPKLGRVAHDSRPAVRQSLCPCLCKRISDQLHKAERAPGKVQKYVPDLPPARGFSSVVEQHLLRKEWGYE